MRQSTFVHAAAYCHTRDANQRCQFSEFHSEYFPSGLPRKTGPSLTAYYERVYKQMPRRPTSLCRDGVWLAIPQSASVRFINNPFTTKNIGVWCAVSATRIVCPIFFETTVNSRVYIGIFEKFYAQVTYHESEYAIFQHDGRNCHTSCESLSRIHDVFTEERTVTKGLWPPRSPDTATCDFYLWGNLKGKVCADNPKTLEDLQENIQTEIRRIDTAELHRVYDSMLQRAQKCIDAQGDHFQHLL